MKVKSIAEHSAILSTFIKLFGIKIFVLSVFEWPFYTRFTVIFLGFYGDLSLLFIDILLSKDLSWFPKVDLKFEVSSLPNI